MGTRDSRAISEDSVIQLQAGRTQRRRGNWARVRLRGQREKNDPPPDPIVGHALGVPGNGMISEGVAVSRATQRAVRDPLGHWWVDYVATKPLQTRAEDGAGVSAAVPLWQPHGWMFHRVCPAQPSRLTQQYRVERSVGRETAASPRVPGQRAHAGRHRPTFPLAPRHCGG